MRRFSRPRRCRRRRLFASPWWRANAVVQGYRSRGRGRASGTRFRARTSNFALRRTRPIEPQGNSGIDSESLERRARHRLAWSRPPMLAGSGASITWRAWPPGAAKDCRAPFLKLPPAVAPSSPRMFRAAGRWFATESKGFVVRPADVRRADGGIRRAGRRSRTRRPDGRGCPRTEFSTDLPSGT